MTTEQTVQEYEEYTVVWDGALSEELYARLDGTIIDSVHGAGGTVDQWLEALANAALEGDGAEVEVFLLSHPHEMGIECECAQYAQDHHPAFTFGTDDDA